MQRRAGRRPRARPSSSPTESPPPSRSREAEAAGTLTEEQAGTLKFLDEVAFAGVRANLGLDQCEIAVTGAAPIPVDILNWFRAIGVPLSEIYGMSESTGPMTWDPYEVRVGTVGRAFPGCDVQLLEDGEVVCRGGNVFQGYLNDPEKTAEALDDDGWLHSGDIGVIDATATSRSSTARRS